MSIRPICSRPESATLGWAHGQRLLRVNIDFDAIYPQLGHRGILPHLIPVENQITYKLVTGASSIDPYRGSAPGRAYGENIYHIYTAEKIAVCSGETVGGGAIPEGSLIGEYRLSGTFIDYDQITVPGFQEQWRACVGTSRHIFSQQFTSYLITKGLMPEDVCGSTWTTVSGATLGIAGRCYGVTASGAPHVQFLSSYPYPS
jgi:hypothetical protein